ncbi:hypothetical protein SMRU11_22775 [Sinorhizobium meliloti RU11/001]|nr:hypothetical protein SMRU11_22775 [Sinorhizobium meliloti RU11/001]
MRPCRPAGRALFHAGGLLSWKQQPLIRPAGHLLPARGAKETRGARSIRAACPFSPLAGRRCRQADEGLPQIRRRSARHQAEQALQELHDHQR